MEELSTDKHSYEENKERQRWLYAMYEYIGTRGTQSQVAKAYADFDMAPWDSTPSKADFEKMFFIASTFLRKDLETRFLKPVEKMIDEHETKMVQSQTESAVAARKRAKRSKR
jgi:hypothetical protein